MPLVDGKLIGKYRKLLISHADLPCEAELLRADLLALKAKHASGVLGEADFTREFILLFATLRAGSMRGNQITGMPGMIFSILNDWRERKASLRLTTYLLTSRDMLAAQAAGWRYVTVDLEAAIAGRTVEQTRDAFEFALHDLGHAYAFFKGEYDHAGQVGFFRALQSDGPQLCLLAERDSKFADALDYAMSDMNSHPQHLREYLRGVIVESFLRQDRGEDELRNFLQPLSSLTGLERVAQRNG